MVGGWRGSLGLNRTSHWVALCVRAHTVSSLRPTFSAMEWLTLSAHLIDLWREIKEAMHRNPQHGSLDVLSSLENSWLLLLWPKERLQQSHDSSSGSQVRWTAETFYACRLLTPLWKRVSFSSFPYVLGDFSPRLFPNEWFLLPLPVHTTACLLFTQQFWSCPLAFRIITFCLIPQSQNQFPEWVCYIVAFSHYCFKHALSCFPFLTWCSILDESILIVKYFITMIFHVCIGRGCSSWGLNLGCQARHPMPLLTSHLLGLWSLYFQVSFGCQKNDYFRN